MRRLSLLTATFTFILTLAGAATAQAQVITLTANLSGVNETPAPGLLSGSFGVATVTLNQGTRTVSWVIDVYNLPSGINNAHFHVGGPGVAGPVVVNVPFTANQSNDFRLSGSATALSFERPDQGIRSWDDFLQALTGGQTYLNVHTVVNGGGEIRGQVIRVP